MNYTIRNLASFDILFRRLARKAAKLGLQRPSYAVTAERSENVPVFELSEGETRQVGHADVIVNDIQITGLEPVKLDGWNFAARIDTLTTGNLIYPVPELEIPARFSRSGCTCDHCRVNRQRNSTFIVRHSATGEWKQVGSTCLADFLGGNSAECLADLFTFYGQIIHDLDSYCAGEAFSEGSSAAYDLRNTLALSIEISERFGWLSHTKANAEGGTATADKVQALPPATYPGEASLAKADTVIEYFASLPVSDDENSLTRNARIIANAGFCSKRSFGLACALAVCHKVALAKIERDARHADYLANAQHIGTPGQRLKGITATIKRVFTFEGQWGVSVKTILEDDNGNVLVGKDLGNEGEKIRFTATVKEHTEYQGMKQTVILRAANIEVLSAA